MFEVGDEVMVYLRKKILPSGIHRMLKQKRYGPCKIMKKINNNVYVVDLAVDMGVSRTFNVVDLSQFYPKSNFYKDDMTASSFLVRENNGGPNDSIQGKVQC